MTGNGEVKSRGREFEQPKVWSLRTETQSARIPLRAFFKGIEGHEANKAVRIPLQPLLRLTSLPELGGIESGHLVLCSLLWGSRILVGPNNEAFLVTERCF